MEVKIQAINHAWIDDFYEILCPECSLGTMQSLSEGNFFKQDDKTYTCQCGTVLTIVGIEHSKVDFQLRCDGCRKINQGMLEEEADEFAFVCSCGYKTFAEGGDPACREV